MKITKLTTYHVLPRWLFLVIETDAGISGYGEPIVEGQSRVVEAAISQLSEYLIGKDPRQIEQHWQWMYRGAFYRGGAIWTSAISGIEQALWDILGKSLNTPIWQLLGGKVRDSIAMYPHCMDGSVAEMVAKAKSQQADGFSAIKIGIEGPVKHVDTRGWLDRQVERFGALRQALGPEMGIAIDFHGRTSPAMAKLLIEGIAPFTPLWVEEPCLPENVDALAEISRSTNVPIASGERLFTKFEFREVIEKRAVSILQPDLCHAGGILETKKIAAMGEAHYMALAPHNPLGPISLAASLQVAASTPNFMIQEHTGQPDFSDLGVGLLKTPFEIVDGSIAVPTGPGLGIELDLDGIAARNYPGDWNTPIFTHDDGSHGDW